MLPFDMTFKEIAALSKPIDTEILVYGRLPLMTTRSCIIKPAYGTCACEHTVELRASGAKSYPVLRAYGCRNLILSSEKLFLADNTKSYSSLDVWGARLSFTTENARECVEIIRRYMGEGEYKPSNTTRGLYFGRAPGV